MVQRTIRRGDGFVQERTAKNGVIRHQARWPELQADGRTVFRSKTFNTLEEAEDHLRKVGRERRHGTYLPESDLTVAELMNEFQQRGERSWTTNTIASFRVSIDRYILPRLGTARVAALTPRQIQIWVDALAKDGRSASTITTAKNLLSSAIRDAMQLGVRDTNPTLGVRVPKRKRATPITWSLEEVDRVLNLLREDPKHYAFYFCAIMTGMRPGELRALQWGDIDFEQRIIHCRRTITRDEHFRQMVGTETKTQRSRPIAIPDELVEALKRWRRHQRLAQLAHPSWVEDDIVFDRGNGMFMYGSVIERKHHKVIDLAKVRKIRLHDLRHTYATLELEAGTHPKIVQERLGHSSISTTLDRYSHLSIDLQRRAADDMAARVFGARIRARKIDD